MSARFSRLNGLRAGCCLAMLAFSTAAAAKTADTSCLTAAQAESAAKLIKRIVNTHYAPRKIDAAFGRDVVDIAIERLDPHKEYLYQSEIDEATGLLSRGSPREDSLQATCLLYEHRQQRVAEQGRQLQALAGNISSMASPQAAVLPPQDWPRTAGDMAARTRSRFEQDLSLLLAAGESRTSASILLSRRYQRQITEAQQPDEDFFALYMNAFAKAFDPLTQYFPAIKGSRAPAFGVGIGIVLENKNGYVSVVRTVPGGPAAKSGAFNRGDRIIAVAQETGGFEDVVGASVDEVVDLLRGDKGTRVKVKLLSASAGPAREAAIVRDAVQLPDQGAKLDYVTVPLASKTYKIAVIQIPSLYADFSAMQRGDADYASTTRDVKRLLAQAEGNAVDGVILDLQNNGGGALMEASKVLGLFLGDGPTAQIKDTEGLEVLGNPPPIERYRGPLLVVVNELTASGAEIVASAIQDYHRGAIAGNKTFGVATVQMLMDADGEGHIKITQAMTYRVTGKSNQLAGIVPDVDVCLAALESREPADRHALQAGLVKPLSYSPFKEYDALIATLKSNPPTCTQRDAGLAAKKAATNRAASLLAAALEAERRRPAP